jgi:hypothetical protein
MRPQFVEYIPRSLEEGVLYVSKRFRTASHLCACGCGTKIVTPLRETEYKMRVRRSAVSLHPSIGNWDHSCQSHYLIKDNRVVWAKSMSRAQIEDNRVRDEAQKEDYFDRLTWPWWRRALYALGRLFA